MSLGATVDSIDLFCGFGGSSQGIHRAGGDVRVAANHSRHSVEVHAANFPDTDHVVADLSDPESKLAPYVDPVDLPPARFVWASPSCRFHSPANARKLYTRGPSLFDDQDLSDFDHDLYANSERSRVTMLCPLRYAAKYRPEAVVVENVVEAAKWGPAKDGSTFRWWLEEWAKLGYDHEVLFLNSMFFPPCPQSRDRMYVVLWRRGNRPPDLDHRPEAWCLRCEDLTEARQSWKARTPAWPMDRWGKWGGQYVYTCSECGSEVTPVAWPAASAIDWSNLGPRVSERDRPLSPNTVERIRRGLARFAAFPVVVTDHAVIAATLANRTHAAPHHPAERSAAAVAGVNSLGVALTEVTHADDGGRNRYRHPGRQAPTSTAKNGVGIATLAVAAGNTFEREGSTTRTRHPAEVIWTQHATGFVGLATLRGTADGQLDGTRHVFDPALVVSAGGGHHGLVAGGWIKQNAGQSTAWHPYSDPFGAITSIDTTGLLMVPWIDQWMSAPAPVLAPVAAALTHLRHSLAVAPPGDPELIDLDEVRFRMLEPDPELRRIMAFDSDFVLFGPKTRITAGLGNAVTPPVADWICQRVIGSLDQEMAS